MEITWLGAAGFRIRSGQADFLIDPFLTRNQGAWPIQPLRPMDLASVSPVFVSHGHFDHAMDLAALAPDQVYCSPALAKTLGRKGVSRDSLIHVNRDGWTGKFDGFSAQAFFSRHIRFDPGLMIRTLAALGPDLGHCIRLFAAWPRGRVLSWRFFLEHRTLHFFGSAGATPRELSRLARKGGIDILFLPLQGHSNICGVAARVVEILRPSTVIPHHWDDFYPPVSRQVDIRPFLRMVGASSPETRIRVPEMNHPMVFH